MGLLVPHSIPIDSGSVFCCLLCAVEEDLVVDLKHGAFQYIAVGSSLLDWPIC